MTDRPPGSGAAFFPATGAWRRAARQLQLAHGLASRTGRRDINQDAVGWYAGDDAERVTHGAVAMLADGMGGVNGGGLAATLACHSFVEAYYGLSPTLGVALAGHRAMSSFNRWLYAVARADAALAGAGCTFTALVFKGRTAHLLHVGDTRAWHWRDGRLTQLSTDHQPPGFPDTHILTRAIGLEGELRLDHASIALEPDDRLLLTSDGVHGVVTAQALAEELDRHRPADLTAAAIADLALAIGSADNASAVVVDIVALPDPDHAGLVALAADLPVYPPPRVGDVIDGLRLERQLSEGEQTHAFVARRLTSGERFVAKFPCPGRTGERGAREAFVRERMIAARMDSPYVARIIALPPENQSQVYTLMPWYEGETLEARLRRGLPGIAEGLAIATRLASGIIALHRLGVIHRDIKPDNVLVEQDGGVRLIDFGVARIPQMEDAGQDEAAGDVPGSHGYLAPELYRGERGDEASDQFAFGVTLYRIFTGHIPFTDLQKLQTPGYDSPADPASLRPDLPAWLALALRRAVQVNADDRYCDMIELLQALERGTARTRQGPASRRRPLSLIERKPVLVWQMVALLLALALIGALMRH